MAKELNYVAFGRGLSAAVADGATFIRIDHNKANGVPSNSGKMSLVASTPGGFVDVPGTDGLRINLNAGYRSKGTA